MNHLKPLCHFPTVWLNLMIFVSCFLLRLSDKKQTIYFRGIDIAAVRDSDAWDGTVRKSKCVTRVCGVRVLPPHLFWAPVHTFGYMMADHPRSHGWRVNSWPKSIRVLSPSYLFMYIYICIYISTTFRCSFFLLRFDTLLFIAIRAQRPPYPRRPWGANLVDQRHSRSPPLGVM